MNLGGPERITDVGPFLYNLFSDPEIIRTPFPVFQKPLAWLISTLRSTTSQQAYLSIGGGSPIRRITEQQARELQSKLRDKGFNATSYIAMRYWHPFTESAIADMKADGVEQVVVIPLYPHFSISTSGSSFRELKKLRDSDDDFKKVPMRCVRSWFSQSGYLKSMVELISEQISRCESPSKAHIFFTAHGVPKSYVEEAGDPYKQQIEDCSLLKILFLLRISFDFSITLISNWSVNISLILHANSMPEGPPPTMNNFLCDAVSCDLFKKEFNLFRS